jgi:uncharacterized protein (TIGR03435 family)
MLRSLLAERFGVAIHEGQRSVQIYALTAGQKPKMKQSDSATGGCVPQPPPVDFMASPYVSYTCRGVTMAKFAEGLGSMANDNIAYPVMNMTGLEGGWDFDLKWTPRLQLAIGGANSITLGDALDKQLGLKMDLRQTPMPGTVVDKVNRKPTPNAKDVEAQLRAALPQKFEVAVLKPTAPDQNMRRFQTLPGGRVEIQGFPLGFLIIQAWDIPNDLLADPPKWVMTDRYDITAKAPAGWSSAQPLDIEDVRPLLRDLLIERFGMKTHTEKLDVRVYVTTKGKGDPGGPTKMKRSDGAGVAQCFRPPASASVGPKSLLNSAWTCHNVTMPLFALRLFQMDPVYFDHIVVDETGIEGAWDSA